jgi:hypothetical protein
MKLAAEKSTDAPKPVPSAIVILFFGSMWPFTAFLGKNVDVPIIVEKLLLYGLLLAVSVTLVFLVLRLIWARSAYLACFAWPAIVFLLFQYSTIASFLTEYGVTNFRYQFPIFLSVTGVVFVGFFILAKASWFRTAVAVTIVVLTVMPLSNIVVAISNGQFALKSYLAGNSGIETFGDPGGLADSDVLERAKPLEFSPESGQGKAKPNVYFLMTDAYSSAKTLASDFGFDNQKFETSLITRGFRSSEPSYSNYPETKTSLSTVFFLNYLFHPEEPRQTAEFRALTHKVVGGENRVVKMFYDRGYDYIHVYNGYVKWSNCGPYVTRCIRRAGPFAYDEIDNSLLGSTPILTLLHGLFGYMMLTSSFMEISDFTQLLPIRSDKPFFLFYHILAPHTPYRFDADCGKISVGEKISKAHYLGQLQCVNKELIRAIDVILQSDPTAIIVVQSDHGYRSFRQRTLNPLYWSKEEKRTAFSNFSAFLLPNACRNRIYKGLSPVNTFRVVFGCIDAKHYPLLPDSSYMPTWPFDPSAKIEIFPWKNTQGKKVLKRNDEIK